jgi:outer membrane lipoprotein-sorting protein
MKTLAFALTLALLTANAYAFSVDEIVSKANHVSYYQGKDGKAKVEMVISDSQGRKRTRSFTILRKDVDDADDGAQKFYVYFTRPADVNKTAFMVWKNMDKDDDRWLYLPALDLVKRIAASDKRTSFVGSHFFYEDVSGRNPAEDNHELLEETDNYYVVKSRPKDANSVEFSYYKNWIHKASFLPVKSEFYDKNGKVYRIFEALKVEDIEGRQTVTAAKVTDTNIGGSTTMSYSKVDYDIGLDEGLFTERYLRNAPRRELR